MTTKNTEVILEVGSTTTTITYTDWDMTSGYLRRIDSKILPTDGCLDSIQVDAFSSSNAKSCMLLRDLPFNAGITKFNALPKLVIRITPEGHKDCNKTNTCVYNIVNGLCLDKFVIENIGKVFFADKYKQNTK